MLLNYLKKAAVATLAACSLGLASQAFAVDLTTSSTSYLGNINDGIPSSGTDEAIYINNLLTFAVNTSGQIGSEFYTRSNNACADCTAAVFSSKDETETNRTFTQDGTITYVLGKYDATKAGAYVWYVGNLAAGTYTIPSNLGDCGNNTGCGLSHFSLFGTNKEPPNRVPEPATLALMGVGLLGLALTRRRKQQ